MAAKSKFTDQEMRDALEEFEGDPRQMAKAAERLGVSPAAVSQRAKRLETAMAPMARRAIEKAEASVWDIRDGLQASFARLNRITDSVETNGAAVEGEDGEIFFVPAVTQLTALVKETRQHHETALKCMEALYRVEEMKAFQDDVLAILGECDPTLRVRVIDRMKKRRGIRAAV